MWAVYLQIHPRAWAHLKDSKQKDHESRNVPCFLYFFCHKFSHAHFRHQFSLLDAHTCKFNMFIGKVQNRGKEFRPSDVLVWWKYKQFSRTLGLEILSKHGNYSLLMFIHVIVLLLVSIRLASRWRKLFAITVELHA